MAARLSRRHVAFEGSHPLVPATCLAGTLLVSMFAIQPVLSYVSLVGAISFSLCCLGPRLTAERLRWQLPLLALVCLANPIFVRSGVTTLLVVGPVEVHAESLAYGACMGATLVSTLLWIECASRVLSTDRLLGLGGGPLPTVQLMLSMAGRLVPQLLARSREVGSTLDACTAGGGPSSGGKAGRVRMTGVLLGWALEDSVERSDSMRARGWGAMDKRTGYQREALRARDALAAACLALLALGSAVLAWKACSEWRFYPSMPTLVPWLGYLPYCVLAAAPTAITLVDRARWARLG